jgi:hypothetical protein
MPWICQVPLCLSFVLLRYYQEWLRRHIVFVLWFDTNKNASLICCVISNNYFCCMVENFRPLVCTWCSWRWMLTWNLKWCGLSCDLWC